MSNKVIIPMNYPTRRARIQAETAAKRSRRGRSVAAGAAGLATLAGAAFAGIAPASANDAAPVSGTTQQNTWSYSGERAAAPAAASATTTSSSWSASTAAPAASSAAVTSTASSGSTGGLSLGTGIQRASYTTASTGTATGSNAAAVSYAAAKASSSSTYYAWGGNGPYGFDCSGLTQQAFAAAGKSIPRGSGAQYTGASQYVSLDNLQPGDLVFWSSNGSASGIYHVAMYIGNGQIAHARNPASGVSVTAVDYNPTGMLSTAARY